MFEKIKILHLEDDSADYELISELIKSEFKNLNFVKVSNKEEFERRLSTENFDVIFSDFAMPGFDGLRALEIKNLLKPEIPFIFISGHIGEDRAIEALKRGAVDYVLKDKLEKLIPAIKRTLIESEEKRKRKEAEDQLKRREELLKEAQVIAKMGNWEYDILENKMTWGENTFLLLEYNPNSVEPSFELYKKRFHPEDLHIIDDTIENLSIMQAAVSLEHRIILPAGGMRWIENKSIPSFEGDKLTKLRGVIIDITEKKELLEKVIKSKEEAERSNALKDAFIANMSHEIRTPLNGLLGLTSIVKELYEPYMQEEDADIFNGINLSGKRLIKTVDMILNYSLLETKNFKIKKSRFNLSENLESLVKTFKPQASSKGIDLYFIKNIEDALIFADQYTITEAISNIIDNGIKYTDNGYVKILLNEKNGETVLKIADSGIGISKDYSSIIFEPYTQEEIGYGRSYEGVGLGLSIAKKYCDLNDIQLSFTSKKNIGTIFTINFGKRA